MSYKPLVFEVQATTMLEAVKMANMVCTISAVVEIGDAGNGLTKYLCFRYAWHAKVWFATNGVSV